MRNPEFDASSEMGSSREVVEEARKGMVVENKVFVAVSKVLKESKSTLSWALQNSNGKKICIIYVHVPAKMIPMPSNTNCFY